VLGIIGTPLIVVIRLLIVRHKVSGDVSLAELISNLLVTCEEAEGDKTNENSSTKCEHDTGLCRGMYRALMWT